jgi:uncharacterized protein (DUF1015 family)
MATVTPFNGILYNPDKIGNSAKVATPPYDVISPEEQRAFYNRHPNNMIRLILNPSETDRYGHGQSPYPVGGLFPAMDGARRS